MSTDGEAQLQNKREFSRVEARIPLEVRFVPLEERRYVRSRLEDEIPAMNIPPDVADPLLAEWLKLLNRKLDILLRATTVKDKNAADLTCQAETISGGGLSFTADREFSPGDVLEVKIRLSPGFAQVLTIYGEVVQATKRADGYLTALRFFSLDDGIQDAIVKFVFEREREILRERRRE